MAIPNCRRDFGTVARPVQEMSAPFLRPVPIETLRLYLVGSTLLRHSEAHLRLLRRSLGF